jgi:anti-sigma B factor antagonist
MKLDIREVNDVTVMDVSGRITLGDGATEFRDVLRQLVTSGHRKILLNLADVTYLDSTGIGTFVSSFATANNAGGHLKLVNLTKRVQDLLLITKLYTVFEIFDNESTALASFAGVAAEAHTIGG